jgi:hypothetical protein
VGLEAPERSMSTCACMHAGLCECTSLGRYGCAKTLRQLAGAAAADEGEHVCMMS